MNQLSTLLLLFVTQLSLIAMPAAKAENTLVIGSTYPPESLDPQVATSKASYHVTRSLFEGLCSDGPEEDGLSYPGMATSWTSSDDLKTWTFKLRDTNKWSDGTPLTAHDFLYSIRRMLSPTQKAKYASMLYVIENAESYRDGITRDFAQVGVKALDDYTLQFQLTNPTPYLPKLTKHHTWFPVPRHVIAPSEKAYYSWTSPKHLVSNGPFKLSQWKHEERITVTKNPHYWDAKSVKLDAIQFRYKFAPQDFLDDYQTKKIHILDTHPSSELLALKKQFPDDYQPSPTFGTNFIRCNVTGPLKNAKIRKAIGLVIPRNDIAKTSSANPEPTKLLIPASGLYKSPALAPQHIKDAKKLMDEAGFPEGKDFPELTFLTTNSQLNIKIADMLKKRLKQELGIQVKVKAADWRDYLRDMSDLKYDLASGGWIGDFNDPVTFLNIMRKDDGNNRTGWSSNEYEKLLNQAAITKQPVKRLKLLALAEKLMLEEYPLIPLWHYSISYFVQPSVQGWNPRVMDNQPYKYISIKTQ